MVGKVSEEVGPEAYALLMREAVELRRDLRDKAVAGKASVELLQEAHDVVCRTGEVLMEKAALFNELSHVPEDDRWMAYWLKVGDNRQELISARGGKASTPPPEMAYEYVENDEADEHLEALGVMVGSVTADAMS